MRRFILILALTIFSPAASHAEKIYDVVVYGATPAGIMAAVQASRQGADVLLLESKSVIGGMITAGLGATDTGSTRHIGGLSLEFFKRTSEAYGVRRRWRVESGLAEKIFKSFLSEQKIEVRKKWEIARVERQGRKIVSAYSETGDRVRGKIFIDSSYEGDLLALAGVTYSVGREARSEFNEPLAGVYPQSVDLFDIPINPYDSGGKLLPGVTPGPLAEAGSADKLLQAYNYRACLTQAHENRIPFAKPDGYDPIQYEILARYVEAKQFKKFGDLFNVLDLPGKKYDLNNKGPISSNLVGASAEYPTASFARRREIDAAHEQHLRGMLWFLQSDPRVPEVLRQATSTWGFCRDEFVETGNWPHQIYVREARRMRGEYILTQHDVQRERTKSDAIGVASKPIESHHVQRYVHPHGFIQNEGFVYTRDDGSIPYDIPYRALVPRKAECENLLVPVSVSSTHIAFSSLRMEPVYMILGMAAGAAAVLAAEGNGVVQDVSYPRLKEVLEKHKQILTWVRDQKERRKPRNSSSQKS